MRASAQRERTIMTLSVVLTLVALSAYVTFDAGPFGTRVRSLLGVDGRINAAVEEGIPGGHFEFLDTQRGSDEPVGFSPCREIHYIVNPERSPPGWEGLVEDAITEVGERTGLAFEYDGTTDDRVFVDRFDVLGARAPVLIAWADEDEVPKLAGDVAGLGGATTLERAGRKVYVTGMVVLDTATFDALSGVTDGRLLQRALLLHELGHLVGLDHVADQGELMTPDGVIRTTYGIGDRRGLAQLGAIPCR